MLEDDRHEDAIKELSRVLYVDEHSSHAHLILGRALLATGKDAQAMTALRAASLRRAIVAPMRVRVAALRLLCETARRLGVELTLTRYRESLHQAERELADSSAASQSALHQSSPTDPSPPNSSSPTSLS